MDLIIKDVPDVDKVKKEIVANAMTTIKNYLTSQLSPSAEELAVKAEIEAIQAKNVIVEKVVAQPKEL